MSVLCSMEMYLHLKWFLDSWRTTCHINAQKPYKKIRLTLSKTNFTETISWNDI